MSDLFNYCNDPDLWKESGKRIEARRKELGMRFKTDLSKAFSEYSPCTRQQIADWEKGNLCINKITDLATLSRILQCDPEYITCQCDTIRKEYADPVDRFGLSENTLHTLENDVLQSKQNYDPEKETQNYFNAYIINFLFEHIEIIEALNDLIDISLFPDNDTETVTYKGPDGELIQIDNYLNGPPVCAYLVNNRQARFIAEQQLIEKLRKVLSASRKEIARSADLLSELLPL